MCPQSVIKDDIFLKIRPVIIIFPSVTEKIQCWNPVFECLSRTATHKRLERLHVNVSTDRVRVRTERCISFYHSNLYKAKFDVQMYTERRFILDIMKKW